MSGRMRFAKCLISPAAKLCGQDHPEARTASLRYRVLQQTVHVTWLEIQLETGRMHQIRIQAASRGHPVLGDELYGSTRSFGPETSDPRERWIALHARSLEFRHPMTRVPVSVTAPLSPYWAEAGIVESAQRSTRINCREEGITRGLY